MTEPRPASARHTVAAGAVVLGMGSALQAALQIVVVAILARLLSPSEFGQVAVALIVIDLANNLAQMGVGQGLVRRPTLDDAYIRTAFTLTLVLGVLISGGVALLSQPVSFLLGAPETAPLLAVASIGILLTSASATGQFLLVRRMETRAIAVRRLLGYFVGYGLIGVGCALLGLGAWSLVCAYLTDVSVQFALTWLRARHPVNPFFSPTLAKEILGFGGGVAFGRIVNAVISQADRAVVSSLFGPAALGLYTRAYQVMRFPGQILGNIIDDIALPGLVRMGSSPTEARRAVAGAVGMCGLLLAPLAAALFFTAEGLVHVLLGTGWTAAGSLLAILSLGLPFRPIQRIMVAKMLADGRPWRSSIAQAVCLGALVICVVSGGLRFGLNGAAGGLALGLVVQSLILTLACIGRDGAAWFGITAAFLRAVPLTAAVAAPVAAATLLGQVVALAPIATLTASIVAGAMTAAACILIAPDLFLGRDGRAVSRLVLTKVMRAGPSSSFASRLLARLA